MKRAHKQLDVWKEDVALATSEGAARHSQKEFSQFLSIAGGSISELDTQIEIALNLGYFSAAQKKDFDLRIDSISAKLAGLIKSVRNRAKDV